MNAKEKISISERKENIFFAAKTFSARRTRKKKIKVTGVKAENRGSRDDQRQNSFGFAIEKKSRREKFSTEKKANFSYAKTFLTQ